MQVTSDSANYQERRASDKKNTIFSKMFYIKYYYETVIM